MSSGTIARVISVGIRLRLFGSGILRLLGSGRPDYYDRVMFVLS